MRCGAALPTVWEFREFSLNDRTGNAPLQAIGPDVSWVERDSRLVLEVPQGTGLQVPPSAAKLQDVGLRGTWLVSSELRGPFGPEGRVRLFGFNSTDNAGFYVERGTLVYSSMTGNCTAAATVGQHVSGVLVTAELLSGHHVVAMDKPVDSHQQRPAPTDRGQHGIGLRWLVHGSAHPFQSGSHANYLVLGRRRRRRKLGDPKPECAGRAAG